MEWQFKSISGNYFPRQFEYNPSNEGKVPNIYPVLSVISKNIIVIYLLKIYMIIVTRYTVWDDEWRYLSCK